jgi:hypothetical protein
MSVRNRAIGGRPDGIIFANWASTSGVLAALRARCDGMSPSLLYERLRELSDAALVLKDGGQRHGLTEIGRSLAGAIDPWIAGRVVGLTRFSASINPALDRVLLSLRHPGNPRMR